MTTTRDPVQEAKDVREQLRQLGWYSSKVPAGVAGAAIVLQLLSRLGQLGEEIQPDSEEAARLKVQCLLEAASRGGGDESVIARLSAIGRPALAPLMNLILNRSENAFRRRASIEAIARMRPLPIPADSAAFPLVQVLRNPVGEDYKVLVLAIRAVATIRARAAIGALEDLEEELQRIAPLIEAGQATTIERERDAALTALKAVAKA